MAAPHSVQPVVLEDNQATIRILESGKSPAFRHADKTQRINLSEQFRRKHYALAYVNTSLQAADILTKPFTSADKWNKALSLMSIRRADQPARKASAAPGAGSWASQVVASGDRSGRLLCGRKRRESLVSYCDHQEDYSRRVSADSDLGFRGSGTQGPSGGVGAVLSSLHPDGAWDHQTKGVKVKIDRKLISLPLQADPSVLERERLAVLARDTANVSEFRVTGSTAGASRATRPEAQFSRLMIELCCGGTSILGEVAREKYPECEVLRIAKDDDLNSTDTRKSVLSKAKSYAATSKPILVWFCRNCSSAMFCMNLS